MSSTRIARPRRGLFIAALAALLASGPHALAQDDRSRAEDAVAPVATAPVIPSREGQDASPHVAEGRAEPETAGYRNGTFFIRDKGDNVRLYPMGRVHVDWLDQRGPGTASLPPGNGINEGFFLRRARLELAGEVFQIWQFMLGLEFASATTIDNPGATQVTPTCAVDPVSGALGCSNRQNAVDSATVKPIPTDVFANYGPSPWANVMVGQFFVPFTLENRVSDNSTPFLERSLVVRDLGVPLQRDIGAMFWGESPDRVLYYAAALTNGDGPNRVNVDSRYDVTGRVVVRPLTLASPASSSTKWAHVGVSARAGSRDSSVVGYDVPVLTTQGGYAFWKPTYRDSSGRTIHIIPSTAQWGMAGDVYLPIESFDVTGEFVYAVDDTREAVDSLQVSPFTERLGQLKGYGWYAQAAYWVLGDHEVLGPPSYQRPVHVDLTRPQKPFQQGLQVLAKFEQLHLSYAGSARAGHPDSKTPDGDIDVDAFELGANYWATKHVRVSFNYSFYQFPDSAPLTATTPRGPQQSAVQRAVAPAQLLAKGLDDSARDSAHTLHEVQARVALQF